ncbi:MAG: molybdenum cofactor biosynthesis protein MoaD [Flavobacteriales bacterium]|nr:MAG: molybdenum cofactor biosynthesis protein MoaD [Flavobacteriales bacterium]
MPTIKFTSALKRFALDLKETEVPATTVAEVVREIGKIYPKLPDYLIDERGELRKHVNIFINNELIADRIKLSDSVKENDEIYIMQALSGG